MIAGPKGAPAERETTLLKDYLLAGGKAFVLLGPGTDAAWNRFTGEFGVEVRTDIIIDPRVQPPIAVATKNFSQDVDVVKSFNRLVIFPEASSLKVDAELKDKTLSVKPFISSEIYTYAKVGDLKAIKSIRQASGDLKGPLPLVVLVKKTISEGNKMPDFTKGAPPNMMPPSKSAAPGMKNGHGSFKFSLMNEAYAQSSLSEEPPAGSTEEAKPQGKVEMEFIVVGNHNFAGNSFVNQMGNMDFFLNSINFLLKDEDLIGIRPREIRQASLELTAENLRQVYATVLLIAGLFLVGGIRAGRRRSTST